MRKPRTFKQCHIAWVAVQPFESGFLVQPACELIVMINDGVERHEGIIDTTKLDFSPRDLHARNPEMGGIDDS